MFLSSLDAFFPSFFDLPKLSLNTSFLFENADFSSLHTQRAGEQQYPVDQVSKPEAMGRSLL